MKTQKKSNEGNWNRVTRAVKGFIFGSSFGITFPSVEELIYATKSMVS